MIRKLTEAECLAAIAQGDFAPELRGSSPKVAVVLTQSWCREWVWMRSYLGELAAVEDVDIYWVEYDREPFFRDFVAFKENVLGNALIPYVRYHRDGVLRAESNYIDIRGFRRLLGL